MEELESSQQSFLIMPYMHSESKMIHEQAITLFSRPGLEFNLDFEKRHKIIIDRFGRYPHRNGILGRQSVPKRKSFSNSQGLHFSNHSLVPAPDLIAAVIDGFKAL